MGTDEDTAMPWGPARRANRSPSARQRRGQTSYHAGAAAEDQVAQRYAETGHSLRNRRWRGGAGEIDLILERDGEIIFVEVKASRSHAQAAASLRPRQIGRLLQSAEAYIGMLPQGSLTPMRFDVALVDGMGRIDVIENALSA